MTPEERTQFEAGIIALLERGHRVPVFITSPKHKAHMDKHKTPVHGCRDCELAWSSLERV